MEEAVRELEQKIKNKRCDTDHPFIFFSYAHDDDKEVIYRVFSELYDSGFNSWIDAANLPVNADGWEKAAQDALRSPNCRLLIYFRSRISLKKDTIRREVESFAGCCGRNAEDIIVVDLSSPEDEHTTQYLEKLKNDGDEGYEVCRSICEIVSTHCNALRYRIDFKNINDFFSTLIREINGRGFPQTFSLQQKIEYILDGTFHVILNPEQEKIMKLYKCQLEACKKDPKTKITIIISGGPGVGKSVLAMAMLNEYIRDQKEQGEDLDTDEQNTGFLFVSKNTAPRETYKGILANRREKSGVEKNKAEEERYDRLYKRAEKIFKGSVKLGDKYGEKNCVKVIVADEARRLVEKHGWDNGRSQTDILVNAAQLSVFFLDEDQMVSYVDYGTKANLKRSCRKYKGRYFVENLRAEMRCGGADSYINWVDSLMQMPDADEPDSIAKSTEYDLRVFDDPNELFEAIVKKNKEDGPARVTAGLCWVRSEDGKKNKDVKEVKIGDFEKSWNLDYTNKSFVSDPDSIDQIGCIHTVQGLEFTYAGVIIGDDLDYVPKKKSLFIDYKVVSKYSSVLCENWIEEKKAREKKKNAKEMTDMSKYYEMMKEAEEIKKECSNKKSPLSKTYTESF